MYFLSISIAELRGSPSTPTISLSVASQRMDAI
jgi:hypothetical protein